MSELTAKQQYLKLIDEKISDTGIEFIIDWLNTDCKKPAEIAFTSGSSRQLAYAIERLINKIKHISQIMPPLKAMRYCPKCGHKEIK